jgi:hypothetical protein
VQKLIRIDINIRASIKIKKYLLISTGYGTSRHWHCGDTNLYMPNLAVMSVLWHTVRGSFI